MRPSFLLYAYSAYIHRPCWHSLSRCSNLTEGFEDSFNLATHIVWPTSQPAGKVYVCVCVCDVWHFSVCSLRSHWRIDKCVLTTHRAMRTELWAINPTTGQLSLKLKAVEQKKILHNIHLPSTESLNTENDFNILLLCAEIHSNQFKASQGSFFGTATCNRLKWYFSLFLYAPCRLY